MVSNLRKGHFTEKPTYSGYLSEGHTCWCWCWVLVQMNTRWIRSPALRLPAAKDCSVGKLSARYAAVKALDR